MDSAGQSNKASTDQEEAKASSVVANMSPGINSRADQEEDEKNFVIDIKEGTTDDHVIGGSIDYSSENGSKGSENVCRICHLDSDDQPSTPGGGSSGLVALGCDCRGELGVAHNHCAEAWFAGRGDRSCEICGKLAKNISERNPEDISIFMMEWEDMRLAAATLDSSRERSRRCKHSFCKFLLLCLVLAFMLPWFFRGMDLFM